MDPWWPLGSTSHCRGAESWWFWRPEFQKKSQRYVGFGGWVILEKGLSCGSI